MERRGLPRQAECGGRLVPADRAGLAHHMVVQPPACRLVQCGDGRDIGVAYFLRVVHEHQCKTNSH